MATDSDIRSWLPIVAAVVDVPLFAYLSMLLFGDPVFGAAVGVSIGVSTYMLFSYTFARQQYEAGERPEGHLRPPRGYHRGAAAMSLVPVGFVPFAWRFGVEDPTIGILAGLLAGVVVYVVFARLLPAEDEAIETDSDEP